ncbi:YbbR-like domain-containing protein [Thermodesulfobacteriota bacterium]
MEKLAQQIMNFFGSLQSRPWPTNWFLQIISLFFALFLWYFVAGEDKVDMNVVIPVEIVNLPRELVISNQFKKQLDVTVSGPRGLIRGLSNQHISRSIDLSKAKPGPMVVQNDEKSIRFPRGIKTLRIQPTHMNLLVDRLVQRDLAIRPVTQGTPAQGFELKSITLEPSAISLNGPQSILGDEIFLSTSPIDLSGLTASVEKQIPMDLTKEISDLIGEPVVTARINIAEKNVTEKLSGIAIDFEHSAERTIYRVVPDTISVQLDLPYGMAKNTEELKKSITGTIDADSLPPGKHELPISVKPPPKTKILKITPELAVIEISAPKDAKKRKPANQDVP